MEKNFLTAEEKMEACASHPDKQQIFALEKMLAEAGYPFYFNFREDLRPTPLGEIRPESIDWDSYSFLIEVGRLAGYDLAEISVTFSTGNDKKLLELLDMRPAGDNPNATAKDGELTVDMTAEDCMEVIEKFFEG